MGEMDFDQAYETLMSANPWSQYDGSVGLRNFAAAASATAEYLRTHGTASYEESGSAGVMTQEVAEAHAAWFDQVASTAHSTANQVDTLVKTGYQHQTTAATIHATYEQAVQDDSVPNPSGASDMRVIHTLQSGTTVLNGAADEWSSSYAGFKPADPPPLPSTTGSGTGGGSGGIGSSGLGSGGPGPGSGSTSASYASGSAGAALIPAGGAASAQVTSGTVRTPGDGGSITVGQDGGDFAGWFKDPTTGYYVDPSTGREFDPVTSRWVDPVTGKPFGDVTQYATGLQGLGPASTTGGLLADTGSTAGAAGSVGAGGFPGLFASANTAAVASSYGGVLPPSLASGSGAAGSLWQQASRSLAVRQQVAGSMLAREEAARTGRPYTPPMQAGLGASAGGGRGRRPSYLVAEEEESGLFSSNGARGRGAATVAEEEAEGAAAANGRRSYLPPAQARGGKDDKRTGRARPDWLVDDDVFGAEPAPSGVLGE